MEDWKLEFHWLELRHKLKDHLDRPELPDLNAILFLIGLQELGQVKRKFTKEQKQDLMHIGVCTLLSQEGYYSFEGLDAEGWPHFKQERLIPVEGSEAQERLLMENAIEYFKELTKMPKEQ